VIYQSTGDELGAEARAVWAEGVQTPCAASGWFPAAQVEQPVGGETILLVEDQAFVREVTAEVLRSAGYRVRTAENATDARSIYEENRGEVDLLLTDVVLPGETGRALATRLKRENLKLRVLLVTGYAEEMGRRTEEGQQCLAKPFSTEVLLHAVRRLLNRGESWQTTDSD